MARLFSGQRKQKERQVEVKLRSNFGLREGELAEELRWDRRTTNNYLRKLQAEGKAEKEGLLWFWKR